MDTAKNVTGTFVAQRTLRVSTSGSGSGTVSGPGISCPGDCSQTYKAGTSITLGASAASGSTFTGWGGACTGTGSCALTMSADKSASAVFAAKQPTTEIRKARINQANNKATFKFNARGNAPATGFQCQLERKGHKAKGFEKCRSPKTYRHLKPGGYTFNVRAKGPGGKDPTPAKKKFRIH
jgi:hypothetical protein